MESEASWPCDLPSAEIESWVEDARNGLENSMLVSPLDIRKRYEKWFTTPQVPVGDEMLKLGVRAKDVRLSCDGRLNPTKFAGGSNSRVGWSIMGKTTNKFFPKVRKRAVRLVLSTEAQRGSRWQAFVTIAAKIGCSAHTLNGWVKEAEVDSSKRASALTELARG